MSSVSRGEALATTDLSTIDAVERGLPASAVEDALEGGMLTEEELYEIVVSRRSLHRRRRSGRLTTSESDALLRVVEAHRTAAEVLGSEEKARGWLRSHVRTLGGRRPIDLLRTEAGGRLVRDTLGRIEFGVYG